LVLVVGCRAQSTPSAASDVTAGPNSEREASNACKTVLVTSRFVRGVLFGAKCGPELSGGLGPGLGRAAGEPVTGFWNPTLSTILTIEGILKRILELERAKFVEKAHAPDADEASLEMARGLLFSLREILENYSSYRRQYLGIIVAGGARRVLVSSFPEATQGAPEEFPSWQRRWVDVDDGGASFWRIEYDVASGTFLGFDVNGSA
jgi:hypothetical protein